MKLDKDKAKLILEWLGDASIASTIVVTGHLQNYGIDTEEAVIVLRVKQPLRLERSTLYEIGSGLCIGAIAEATMPHVFEEP